MTEEKKRILDMLAEGKITTEEAALLLEQFEDRPAAPPVYHPSEQARGGERMFRVLVVARDPKHSKPTNITVNLPLKAARIAGRLINTMLPAQAVDAMQREGVNLSEIDLVELINALEETGGDIVNISSEEEGEQVTVRVFID